MSKKKNVSSKLFRSVAFVCVALIVGGMLAAGCATPTPEVVP